MGTIRDDNIAKRSPDFSNTYSKVKTSGSFWYVLLSLFIVGGGLFLALGSIRDSYRPSLARYRIGNGSDPIIGSLAPAWLTSQVHGPGYVVAISCATCTGPTILRALERVSKQTMLVLLVGGTPGDLDEQRRTFPRLRFESAPEDPAGLNVAFAPRLYHLDSNNQFDYIQKTYMLSGEFLRQVHD